MTGSDQPQPADSFDLDKIRSLIELMQEHDLGEVDLRHGDERIRLCRAAPAAAAGPPAIYAGPPAAAANPAVHTEAAAPPPDNPNIVTITSPTVGTFYSRPNPKADAYVKLGDSVEPETTVCIIEAMKLFNEIPAEVRGKIVAILVDEEEPVDVGKPLFKVDTSG